MKIFFPLLLILILFSSSTCENTQSDPNQPTSQQVNILNTTWHLESMTLMGKKQDLFPATLMVGEQKITGKGGCNNFFGKYELEGDRISMSKIGATRMYCQEASKFETKYLRALEQVTGYSQKQGRLYFSLPDGELVFSSNPVETIDMEPKGTIQDIKWQLKAIAKKGVVKRIKSDISLLVEKEKVSGNGGCNTYFGQLRMEGSRFVVSDIGATEMYCEATSKQEASYFQMLEKITSYKFEDNQLTLIFPDGELIFGRK